MGPPDMGPPDMGPPDMGPPDMGPTDMGPPDMGPPDMTDCCQVKYSPGSGMYRYYNITPGLSEQYGCLDDCLYMKEGTREKYCFGPGDLQVSCDDPQGLLCGPQECQIYCYPGQTCVEDPDYIQCVQAPCCEMFSCEEEDPLSMTGYLTVLENGAEFKQKNEDMPDYLKISVPAHNNYPEAVVFYEKESSMRVSCTQGRDTAAEVEWVNTTAVMEYVKDYEGKVIDASKETVEYFVETVTREEIPDAERPVDIAPDRPVFRSTIRLASPREYEEALQVADELPVCIRWPNTHHITIRVDVEVQIQTQEKIQRA